MEALSGGCVANSYMIRDRTAKWNAKQEGGSEAEKQAPIGQAFFIMKEQSDCWCRACCNPAQPNLVKFWNTAGPYERTGRSFFVFCFLFFVFCFFLTVISTVHHSLVLLSLPNFRNVLLNLHVLNDDF